MNRLSDYYSLKEDLKEKKNELWRLQQEYNSIVQQEPYMRGRLKNRQHTIYKLAGEIKSIEKELKNMEKAHLQDSMDMLKLIGLTVDADCEKIYTKGESTEDQCKDGGPGSGIKGHTTSKEPSYTSRSGYNFEEPKVIEAAIKKVKESGHPDSYYLAGLERALELSKKERGMRDDDATEMGTFEQLGQNHETEAMEPSEHPVQAQDAMSKEEAYQILREPHKYPEYKVEEAAKVATTNIRDEIGEKFKTVMEEFGKGELKSSSGEKVTDPKQAKAIAYSEQREAKDSDPKVAEANKLINLFGGAM